MTVSIIEGNTSGTKIWTPILIGNTNANKGIRYVSQLSKPTVVPQHASFATMSFNKDGGVSESEGPRRQRIYESYSPLLHSMCRAIGTRFVREYRDNVIDRMSLRAVHFATQAELIKYMDEHNIQHGLTANPLAKVSQLVIPQTQTVAELYQHLGRIIATSPQSIDALVVAEQPITDFKMTDDQLILLQRRIQMSLIDHSASGIAKRLQEQANSDIAKLYAEFGMKNPPVIKLVTEVVKAAGKAGK